MVAAIGSWLLGVFGWLWLVLMVAGVVAALLRRREPAAALGWSLAIVFLPGLGLGLFLVFGSNRVPRRLRRRIRHHESFARRLPAPGETEGGDGADPPWRRLGRVLEDLGEGPRRTGNRLVLYTEGIAAFQAMEDAVRAAEHHVHVEFYIVRDDDLGRYATELLAERARAGVEVRVLVDAIGSMGARRMFRRLERAGGELAEFLPVRPFGKRVTPNLRNHRKTVVCDGRVAFFGGLNVGAEYLGRYGRGRDWCDLHVELRGPSVVDLQRMFVDDWDFATGALLAAPAYYPRLEPAGDATVQILPGGPHQDVNAIREAFFGAFVRARTRILVATPYLVPDPTLRDALASAARSGVEVDIVTQWPPGDIRIAQLCGEWMMSELLEAGVRVHGYRPGMMHAKAVAVDGAWGMIGTANLDNRSLHLNFEQMAVLDGAREVSELEDALGRILARSTPYTLDGLAARSRVRRLLSGGARLLAPLL